MDTTKTPSREFHSIAVVQLVLFGMTVGYSVTGSAQQEGGVPKLRIESSEFVFNELPHASCHASTLAETKSGLVCAWFGGKREGDPSVGIWFSKQLESGRWSTPRELVNGIQKDGQRFPCWNPVLYQIPDGELILFFKVGPNPREWWGEWIKSSDGGMTWSKARRLPKGTLGPIKNKPVLAKDGRLICGSSTEHNGWKVHMEWTSDLKDLQTWDLTPDLEQPRKHGAIQPTILEHADGKLQILCRSQKRDQVLSSFTRDGENWSALKPIDLPNPNSGIDGVTLNDGSHVLIYNHTRSGRSPLNVGWSRDGLNWKNILALEDEPKAEFSYPAVIETNDGKIHVTYTWKRKKIKHVVLKRVRD